MRILKLLTYLLAPALAFSVFRIEDIVSLVVGTKWPNLPIMAWFCMFPALILVFTGPLDRVFDLVGRQRLSVSLQLVSDVVMLLTIVIAVQFSASAQVLVGLISLVLVLYNAIWLCFTLRALDVPARQIGDVFIRFAIVFALSMLMQWLLWNIAVKPLSWIAAILFLGLSTAPGIASFGLSFPFFRNRINQSMINTLQGLP
jgi:hypothetical protein